MSEPAVDKFGKFIVVNLRDRGIDFLERALAAEWKGPALASLQAELLRLTPEQADTVRKAVTASLDHAMHDFLFALAESADFNLGVTVTSDSIDVAKVSDGLHGEAYGDSGWIAKFSAHPDSASGL